MSEVIDIGGHERLAQETAMRCIPMQVDGEAYRQRVADFVKGYMAGRSAHIRWANNKIFEYRAAVSAGEKHVQD